MVFGWGDDAEDGTGKRVKSKHASFSLVSQSGTALVAANENLHVVVTRMWSLGSGRRR